MVKKNFYIIFLIIFSQLYKISFAQLDLKVTTDKAYYQYGENIIIKCSVRNTTDTIITIYAPSFKTCQAEFSFNNFKSWEHTQCLTMTEKIKIKPFSTKIYRWTINPHKYGLPNKDGEQNIIGYFIGGLTDTVTITAPKFYGGQLIVNFYDSLENDIKLLKDTLSIEVLNRYDKGSLGINEIWQIENFNIDSLVEQYSKDKRFTYVEKYLSTQYDSIYTEFPMDYFPIHVGDVWSYFVKKETGSQDNDSTYYKTLKVVSTEILDGKEYFKIENSINKNPVYLKVDSATASVYYYNLDEHKECLINKLSQRQPYSSIMDCNLINTFIMDTLYTVFNVQKKIKVYNSVLGVPCILIPNTTIKYAEGIGKVFLQTEFPSQTKPPWYLTETLVYAKIGDKYYGDSTVVGIKENKNLPKSFITARNYPNPFNPSTVISFTIPQKLTGNRAVLTVYNIQGEVIKVLLDKKLQAGTHLTRWNGTNKNNAQVSSGVYFYEIKIGEQKYVGKMNLMR